MSTLHDGQVDVVTEPPPGRTPRHRSWMLYLLLVAGALSTVGVWQAPDNVTKAWVAVLLMVILLLLRVPVGIAMGVAGVCGLLSIGTTPAVAHNSLAVFPFGVTASWSLSVLPMFILMGMLLWRSGVTERLYDAARLWLGWLPGGLAVTTTTAGAGMASASGSTLGITYALGRIATPEMLRSGYDRRLALGSVLMAGTIGQLIPPSILMVIYAGVAQTAVGPQLMAGLVPGVLLALAYCGVIVGLSVFVPGMDGRRSREVVATWRDRTLSLVRVWPVPLLSILVLGSLYGGVVTATEAGAFGAMGAALVTIHALGLRKGLRTVIGAAGETVISVAAIMFLLIGAAIFNRMLALSGATREISESIGELGLGRMGLVLLLMALFFVLGMFLESTALVLLAVPVLMPAVIQADISLIWFGVFVVMMAELGVVTPPVGILAFVLHKIVQEPDVNLGRRISLVDVFAGGMLFIPITVAVILLLAYFPELVEWLPSMGQS